MKKAKALRVLALAVAAAGAVLVGSACTNPVLTALTAMTAKTYGLTGTWGNDAYTTNGFLPAAYRLTFRDDGTVNTRDLGGASNNFGTYTINSLTVSGDSRTYQVYAWCGYSYYCLVKVSGSTLEIQTGGMNYPTTLIPGDITYGIYTPK